MPFEHLAAACPTRIAIIGGGISGMAAAYHLGATHSVTLFEAEPRLGGHARTVMAGKNGDQPVDTGFIVFNKVNYPGLTKLFHALDVPIAPSDMSFGASLQGGRIEYGLRDLRSLLAQPHNLARPAFLRMVGDLLRFNRAAVTLAEDDTITLGDFLARLGTGPWFRDRYLTPLSGAIWSTPPEQILEFPAQALVRFFRNHNLLQISGQHEWWTVRGGSIEYVTRLQRAMLARGVDLRLGMPVEAVLRQPAGGVTIRSGGAAELFDEVIFATHSDDALRLLADPSPDERRSLARARYQPNRAVLHADAAVMPKRRAVWSSWNYTETPGDGPIDLTYWMNSLQPIPMDDPMFVTLNSRQRIDPAKIYDTVTFRHPVYDLDMLAAQKDIARINGDRQTWFCGAWMKNGFHEDGYASAMDVVAGIARRSVAAMAAE